MNRRMEQYERQKQKEDEFFLNADIEYFNKKLEEAISNGSNEFKVNQHHFENIAEGRKNLALWNSQTSSNVNITESATEFIISVR